MDAMGGIRLFVSTRIASGGNDCNLTRHNGGGVNPQVSTN